MIKPPPITIWIHGTKPQQLFPGPLARIQIDALHKFMYCHPGLSLAQDLEPIFHHYTIAETLFLHAPLNFPQDTFYLFGWSGALSHQERLRAAQKLATDLKDIILHYEETYHEKPHLRIITHSHGGNVALNLATLSNEQTTHIEIQELILLACPVQKTTAALIKSPLFKSVYSLHSHGDLVQIADPQGWPNVKEQLKKMFQINPWQLIKTMSSSFEQEPFFSERHFQPLSKLVQARIKINSRDPLHVEFMLPGFIKHLPRILSKIRELHDPSATQGIDIAINILPHEITITL